MQRETEFGLISISDFTIQLQNIIWVNISHKCWTWSYIFLSLKPIENYGEFKSIINSILLHGVMEIGIVNFDIAKLEHNLKILYAETMRNVYETNRTFPTYQLSIWNMTSL